MAQNGVCECTPAPRLICWSEPPIVFGIFIYVRTHTEMFAYVTSI